MYKYQPFAGRFTAVAQGDLSQGGCMSRSTYVSLCNELEVHTGAAAR